MNNNILNEKIVIAEIHAERISLALTKLEGTFPLDSEKVKSLDQQQLLYLELLISRFAKLQDLIGQKLIDEYLQQSGVFADNLTMIDKINKLERLEIIEKIGIWQKLRDIRNHASNEYPNHPELTAKYLNQLHELTPELIKIFDRLKSNLS